MSTIIQWLVSNVTLGPAHYVAEVLTLGPAVLPRAIVLLAAMFLLNDLVRTTLMSEGTRSVVNHLVVCVLTLFPAFMLGGVLLWAGHRHPDRVWINLGIAALLYVPWWAGGMLTKLARPDTEGADLGWMAMGAFITFPLGLVAALVS